MANVCETKITVIGLKEPAEGFVKALSKAMFGIDLDNPDPTRLAQTQHDHQTEEWSKRGAENPSRQKENAEQIDNPRTYDQ